MPGTEVDEARWPGSVPAVTQLLRDGLEVLAGVTVLVGENGSGKSTVMECLAGTGSQVVVATHSPVVAALPGAHVLELGAWGIRPAGWDDLGLVVAWRQFLGDP